MINFVVANIKFTSKHRFIPYKQVIIDSFLNPITAHLTKDQYTESVYCKKNCVNVLFFREKGYRDICKFSDKLISVFIPHGIADKNWSDYDVVKYFNYVFVAGNLKKQKLINQGLSEERIKINGYTKFDLLNSNEIIKNNKPVILFAPTHDSSVTAYGKLDNYLQTLSDKFEIIISNHPANNDGNITTTNLIKADVVISDFGSIMYEAWALNKPVILPNWLLANDIAKSYPNSFEDKIYKEKIGYHANSFEDVENLIKMALSTGITKQEQNFIEEVFPSNLRQSSGKTTAELLIEIDKQNFSTTSCNEKIYATRNDASSNTFISVDNLMLKGINKGGIYRESSVRSKANGRTRRYKDQ